MCLAWFHSWLPRRLPILAPFTNIKSNPHCRDVKKKKARPSKEFREPFDPVTFTPNLKRAELGELPFSVWCPHHPRASFSTSLAHCIETVAARSPTAAMGQALHVCWALHLHHLRAHHAWSRIPHDKESTLRPADSHFLPRFTHLATEATEIQTQDTWLDGLYSTITIAGAKKNLREGGLLRVPVVPYLDNGTSWKSFCL